MLIAFITSLLLTQAPAVVTKSPSSLSPAPADEPLADALPGENLDDENDPSDPLEYSQKERQALFRSGLALNIGPVMPWSITGASILWAGPHRMQSVSLGAGDFEFSNNYRERNYLVQTDSQSAYYAARWFVLGFGPLYVEPFAGLARWSGSIKPRGFDNVADELSSSLNSRFDITGVSIGGNLGIMWIFSNGLFLDYNLLSLSSSAFIQQSFTSNTEAARKNVRREIAGPLMMGNLHLRLGWSFVL